MKKKEVFGLTILFACALIWGTAFVAQDFASKYLTAWMFNGCRFLLGGLVLLPVILVIDIRKKKEISLSSTNNAIEKKDSKLLLILSGIGIGIVLAISSFFQQKGIELGTEIGKAGFITDFYIIIVPVACFFIFKQKYGINVYLSIVLAFVGLYLLGVSQNFSIQQGDLFVLIGAFGYSIQIILIDYFSKHVDPIKLSSVQMISCGLISLLVALIFEKNSWDNIVRCLGSIFYAGVMSCGLAYTFQVVGQKYVSSTIASLIMSLESTVSAICQVVILRSFMSTRELVGCIFMFTAIVLSQISFSKIKELCLKIKKNNQV